MSNLLGLLPNARDDSYYWTEDQLFVSSLFDATRNIARLNVLANDTGFIKKLWSIDDGDRLLDLLKSNINTGWEATANGNQIRIHNQQIEIDISNQLIAMTGSDNIQALGAGMTLTDSFTYGILIDAAAVTFTVTGENDAATIIETPGGDHDVAKGTSELSFGPAALTPTDGNYASDIHLADVNGDGHMDVLTASTVSSTVSILYGDGNGNLGTPQVISVYGGVALTDGVTVAHMNADAFLDIVTADASGSAVSVLLNDGAGGFPTPAHYSLGGAGHVNHVVTADFDGDGDLDVAANGSSNAVAILKNDGNGMLTADPLYNPGVSTPGTIAAGDIDQDGDIDVVTTGLGSNEVAILLNDGGGTGTFSNGPILATGGLYPGSLVVIDIDGDTWLDILVANTNSQNISVFLNGAGGFAPAALFSVGAATDGPRDIQVADVDGDGKLDVVTANHEDGTGNSTASVLLGDGAGGFGAPNVFANAGNTSTSLGLADFNGDGKIDIATAQAYVNPPGPANNTVSVMLNTSASSPGDSSASGDLDITDVDFGEAKFAAVSAADLEGTYGDFLFDSDTGAWSYALDNSDPDTVALAAGPPVQDALTVFSYDGSANYTILVNVFGGASEI